MRLLEVRLSNFCGFSSFRLPLGEFNVLVGPNNGGKTTILRNQNDVRHGRDDR